MARNPNTTAPYSDLDLARRLREKQKAEYAQWSADLDLEQDGAEYDSTRSGTDFKVTQEQFDSLKKLFDESPFASMGTLSYNRKNGQVTYEGRTTSDPKAADYGQVTKVNLTERMGIIIKAAQEEGLKPHQIHALIGNCMGEDFLLNPNAIGDGGAAFGIFQHHPDRRRAFAAKFGYDMTDKTIDPNRKLADEVKFAIYEMKTTEKKAGNRFFASTDVGEAVAAMVDFERPADRMGAISRRLGYARGVEKQVAALKVDDARTASLSPGTTNTAELATANKPTLTLNPTG